MTLQEFTAIFSRLLEAFDETNISEIKAEVYYNLLKEFDLKTFGEACKNILQEYEYKNGLPLPATFFKACVAIQDGVLDLKARDALNLAKRTAQSLGDANSVYFSSKALSNAISLFGGWVAFCNTDWDGGTGIANERKFIECYKLTRKEPLREPYHKGTNELRNGYTDTDREGKEYIAVAQISKDKPLSYTTSEILLNFLESKNLIQAKNNKVLELAKGLLNAKTFN